MSSTIGNTLGDIFGAVYTIVSASVVAGAGVTQLKVANHFVVHKTGGHGSCPEQRTFWGLWSRKTFPTLKIAGLIYIDP